MKDPDFKDEFGQFQITTPLGNRIESLLGQIRDNVSHL